MKTTSLAAIFLTAILAAAPIFARLKPAPGARTAGSNSAAKAAGMKDVLLRLVRADECLDGVIDKFNASGEKFSAHETSALGLTLKNVKSGLDAVSARNKVFFFVARPSAAGAVYTQAILSYSGSISRKAIKVGALLAGAAIKNKKNMPRDAVSSTNGRKTINGKKLALILEEQKALERLSADIQSLKASARKLTATSKWLHIVSR